MNKKVNSLMILSFVGLLAACGSGGKGSSSGQTSSSGSSAITSESGAESSDIASDTSSSAQGGDYLVKDSPYDLLNGKKARRVYNGVLSTGVTELNYLHTSAAQNAQHFANFVDGILTHNDFGFLVLNLAEEASHNRDYTEFTFKIRDDDALCWVKYDGTPYTYVEDGVEKIQKVKPADFVAGLRYVCDFRNLVETADIVNNFIVGGGEYYYYTEIKYYQAQGIRKYKMIDTPKEEADYINGRMAEEKANITALPTYSPLTADDMDNVYNGNRFGVTANEEDNTVTYNLYSSAFYFPSLLTYSCFLPVNEHFLKEKGSAFGTSSRDSILYCGPYRIDYMDETSMIFKKNERYAQRADLRGFMQARAETINYYIENGQTDSSYGRTHFENGTIDGFSVLQGDTEGWKNYVVGPNRNPTSTEEELECIENPYNPNVNSRLTDTISNMYGSNIVMERTSNNGGTSYSSSGSKESVKNTERALRLDDVRAAILGGLDYSVFYKRYADTEDDLGYESVMKSQRVVHTYVPKNFVYDDNGNEYVDAYFTKEYALKHDLVEGSEASGKNGHYDDQGQWQPDEGTAAAIIKNGQYDHRNKSKAEVADLVDRALKAIELYNASTYADTLGRIELPINIEYYSMWDVDQEEKSYDIEAINSMNLRLNKLSEAPAGDLSNCPYFHVIPTDGVTKSNYNDVSGSSPSASASYDYSPVLWGWGADYGDPLTYMNTYKKGGDWKSVMNYIDDEYINNFTTTGEGDEMVLNAPVDLLGAYSAKVDEGAAFTENLYDRYTAFAEAEYMLIHELHIYEPQVNYGQGWSLSVSRSAGYEMPTSNYGLSNDRLTGMWVLDEVMTRDERKIVRDEFNAAKKAYAEIHDAYDFYTED